MLAPAVSVGCTVATMDVRDWLLLAVACGAIAATVLGWSRLTTPLAKGLAVIVTFMIVTTVFTVLGAA